MPLEIIRQDITKIAADAIVNAANETLLGVGGVGGAIHKAAGEALLRECEKLGGCRTGEAKLTKGYELPAKYVIHTVGPVWQGGGADEEELLRSCYRESLRLAKAKRLRSIAFPLISAGAYGYPRDKALRVAVDEISSFLLENEMRVIITVFDKASFSIGEKLFARIRQYIDDNYAKEHGDSNRRRRASFAVARESTAATSMPEESFEEAFEAAMPPCQMSVKKASKAELKNMLKELDESFSQMLLRKIDEKGMTDAQCYKKANIDRKLFSKIRSDKNYRPKKTTALAFAIALELSLSETAEMLKKAGYALSHSNEFDIIIEFFIKSGNYNIHEINEALFAFDQMLLGV